MKKIISLSFYPILIILISMLLQSNQNHSKLNNKSRENISVNYIPWIKNVGQYQSDVLFKTTTFVSDIIVKQNRDISYYNKYGNTHSVLFEESFLNSIKFKFKPKGLDKTKTKVNYFVGKRENHFSNISTFNIIDFGEVWKGIEVKLKATNKNYEKLFVIDPSADPSQINIEIKGVNDLCINEYDELQVDLSTETICFTKPKAWQEINSKKVDVKVDYQVYLHDNNFCYSFEIGAYDQRFPLLIDPLLASTYIGGIQKDFVQDIVIDKNDKVYVTGNTQSDNFPTTTLAYDNTYNDVYSQYCNDCGDIFIARFSTDLSTLEVCTFIGGADKDIVYGMELDNMDNVFLTGYSKSRNYPTTQNAYDNSFNGVNAYNTDIIISKFDKDLSTLLSSTFIGSESSNNSYAIDINNNGDVYITGSGNDLPTVGPQFHSDDVNGIFFLKINNNLSNILATNSIKRTYSSYSKDICIDYSGNIIVVGLFSSSGSFPRELPTTEGCFDDSFNGGGEDGFIIKLSSDLSTNLGTTYFGGTHTDEVTAVTSDMLGNIYITGETKSFDFPSTPDSYDPIFDWENEIKANAFISIFDSNLKNLLSSTCLGVTGSHENGNDIIIDIEGNIIVSGSAGANFPVSCNAIDNNSNTGQFISKFNFDLSELIVSTYVFGGRTNYINKPIDQNSNGDLYICGSTYKTDFPTLNSYDDTYNDNEDGYVVKLTSDLTKNLPCCTKLNYPFDQQQYVPSDVTFEWNPSMAATGYYISIGTTPFINNILDNFDAGNNTSFYIENLPCSNTIYVNISAYNEFGLASGPNCATTIFYTDSYYEEVVEHMICDGEEFEWNGVFYKESGIYKNVFKAANGCDSIHYLILDVKHSDFISDTENICTGDSLLWFDQFYKEAGIYYKYFTNIYNCDSIHELILLTNETSNTQEYQSICNGDTLMWENQIITTEGTYYSNHKNLYGCDSLVTLDVIQNPEYEFFDTARICEGEYYQWLGHYYYSEGDYTNAKKTIQECDSIFNLHLIVNQHYYFEEDFTICNGESINWQGKIYDEPGVYNEDYLSITGCDSNFQLTIYKNEIDSSIDELGNYLIAKYYKNASYQWMTCPSFEKIENPDQNVYMATESGSFAVEITKGECIDTSLCINIVHSNITEVNKNDLFDIFPNPIINNYLTIRPKVKDVKYSIDLINLSGHKILKLNHLSQTKRIDFSSFNPGLYLLVVKINADKYYHKIIKTL